MTHSGDEDDPFFEPSREEAPRTVLSPRPGGRAPEGRRETVSYQEDQPDEGLGVLEAEETRPGVNSLVDAAAELFDLVVYLRAQTQPLETASLRRKALALIKAFERDAAETDEDRRIVRAAKYAITVTLDDAVYATPWGLTSGWASAPLVGASEEEQQGGDHFFVLLEQAERDPRRFANLLEFMYLCISLGFMGRFRHEGRGRVEQLEAYRKRVFALIDRNRDGLADTLALRWKGIETQRKPIRELIPTWLAAALSVLVVAGLFSAFFYLINVDSDRAIAAVGAMPPLTEPDEEGNPQRAAIQIVPYNPPEPLPKVKPRKKQDNEVFKEFLAEEIAEKLVEVPDDSSPGEVHIRLLGGVMFDHGQDKIKAGYQPTLERVAEALNNRDGDVVIEGHTDSTGSDATNYKLSEKRAKAVSRYMAPFLIAPERVLIDPKGEAEPIANNKTKEGRARNRRVEIVLKTSAEAAQ